MDYPKIRKDHSLDSLEYYVTSEWTYGLETVFMFYYLENLDIAASYDLTAYTKLGLNDWSMNPAILKSHAYRMHN